METAGNLKTAGFAPSPPYSTRPSAPGFESSTGPPLGEVSVGIRIGRHVELAGLEHAGLDAQSAIATETNALFQRGSVVATATDCRRQ